MNENHNNALLKEKQDDNEIANRSSSKKNSQNKNEQNEQNEQENKEEDLKFFKQNEEKIVFIQSGFRGYKIRKDLEKKEQKVEDMKKEPENKNDDNNISKIENPQNANNSKYFESDKEVVEFGT